MNVTAILLLMLVVWVGVGALLGYGIVFIGDRWPRLLLAIWVADLGVAAFIVWKAAAA